jgi:hypothetical protein
VQPEEENKNALENHSSDSEMDAQHPFVLMRRRHDATASSSSQRYQPRSVRGELQAIYLNTGAYAQRRAHLNYTARGGRQTQLRGASGSGRPESARG